MAIDLRQQYSMFPNCLPEMRSTCIILSVEMGLEETDGGTDLVNISVVQHKERANK